MQEAQETLESLFAAKREAILRGDVREALRLNGVINLAFDAWAYSQQKQQRERTRKARRLCQRHRRG